MKPRQIPGAETAPPAERTSLTHTLRSPQSPARTDYQTAVAPTSDARTAPEVGASRNMRYISSALFLFVGLFFANSPNANVGPSFECTRARDTLALIICADVGLRELDLEMVRAYYALRYISDAEHPRLRNEAADHYKRVVASCGLPPSGDITADLVSRSRTCIRTFYERQRESWKLEAISRSTDAAYELNSPIADHLALQAALAAKNYLPSDSTVDGVYGPSTRSAIRVAQADAGLRQTGFPTGALKEFLPAVATPANVAPIPVPASTPQSAVSRPPATPDGLRNFYGRQLGPDVARDLFVGFAGDLLLFSNENTTAPNFFRRLTGDAAFRNGRMNVCALGNARAIDTPFGDYAASQLRNKFSGTQIDPPSPWGRLCGSMQANTQDDVIALLRSDVLSFPTLQELLTTALGDKKLRILLVVTRAPHDAAVAQYMAKVSSAPGDIKANRVAGYGLLSVENPSERICSTIQEDGELINKLSLEVRPQIVIGKKPALNNVIIDGDADMMFHQTKGGRCGFIFDATSTLSTFYEALLRDGTKAQFVPFFLSQDRMTQVRDAFLRDKVAAEEERRTREAEETQRRAEAQRDATRLAAAEEQRRHLEEVRRRNDETQRREELQRLRSTVTSRGRAISSQLEQRLKRHIDSVNVEISEVKQRARLGRVLTPQEQRTEQLRFAAERMDQMFPSWAAMVTRAVQEEWEFGNIQTQLEDYGKAIWRNRTIEAVAVRAEFPMLNRHIGERRTDCQVFVWILDEEFQIWRQAITLQCGSFEQAFGTWATTNQFQSQWKLPPQ
jgi:hypothetical protein